MLCQKKQQIFTDERALFCARTDLQSDERKAESVKMRIGLQLTAFWRLLAAYRAHLEALCLL